MENMSVVKLLLKLSPPVMLALLIQSIYNIVDSFFISRYSAAGLTALSIIFPIQLLMTALATGTGTGINILVSRMDGTGETKSQTDIVKSGLFSGFFNYVIFACAGLLLIRSYFAISSDQIPVQEQGIPYAQIIFAGSLGLFIESNCTKILQAKGNMLTPMIAQVTGAVINVILDPILIFGMFGMPESGAAGAALATIAGQLAAMLITLAAVCRIYRFQGKIRLKDCIRIYRAGIPSIVMQSLYTLYIIGLNLILKQFTEDAVTVLGIYYKLQTFFFIPLMGLQQVILPVISFHYGAGKTALADQPVPHWQVRFCCPCLLRPARLPHRRNPLPHRPDPFPPNPKRKRRQSLQPPKAPRPKRQPPEPLPLKWNPHPIPRRLPTPLRSRA